MNWEEEVVFDDFLFSFAQIVRFLAVFVFFFRHFFLKTSCQKHWNIYICNADVKNKGSYQYARIAQLVEHNLAKVGVASSSLVSRSMIIEVYPFVQ